MRNVSSARIGVVRSETFTWTNSAAQAALVFCRISSIILAYSERIFVKFLKFHIFYP